MHRSDQSGVWRVDVAATRAAAQPPDRFDELALDYAASYLGKDHVRRLVQRGPRAAAPSGQPLRNQLRELIDRLRGAA